MEITFTGILTYPLTALVLVYAAAGWLLWPKKKVHAKDQGEENSPLEIFTPDAKNPLPQLLQAGELFVAEGDLLASPSFPVSEIPDQLYKVPTGELAIVDTKNRNQMDLTYSEQIQLSRYKLALERQGHQVLPWAYIRFHTTDGEQFRRVTLLEKDAIYALGEREPISD